MQNNLLRFDPAKAKNGDVVFHSEIGGCIFIGMDSGTPVVKTNTIYIAVNPERLRLRPRMVKRWVNIYPSTAMHKTKEEAHNAAIHFLANTKDTRLACVEIEVPE